MTTSATPDNFGTPVAFGRYQLIERIGKGGMAEVFRARLDAAAGTEKLVCIKRILPHLSSNSDFMSLFVSEAKVSLPLTHGNITQVFDFGEVDGAYFLAMEYVRGQNLAQLLGRLGEADGTMDISAALFVASEVCRGLQYAHAYTDASGKPAVVVHRDVTPHNILISYNGEVKLTDFGIALAAKKAPPGEHVLRGKPSYLSPEQADGSPGDARSDVFAMGTVLFEMLTGARPFEAETDGETLERVRTLAADPPSAVNHEVDGELDRIVLKALAKDPDQRYQRAGDLQVDLARVLHQRNHDYTAQQLAGLMKELFAWEMQGSQSDGGENRDRLLFQLARAGVQLDGREASTDELLQVGTVAIGGGKRVGHASNTRSWPWIAAGVVLLVAAITVAVLIQKKRDAGVAQVVQSGQPTLALPRTDPTEHLIPASLRDRTPGSEAPAERASAAAPAPVQAAQEQPAKRPRKIAYLNCNSWPWSVVYLNGRRLHGNTPLYRVRVPAGRHRIRFVNPELGLSKEVNVSVSPGGVRTVAVKLRPSTRVPRGNGPDRDE